MLEIILALCLGVTLSAAAGFRIFVPPLVMSVAANYGHIELSPDFQWLGSNDAMIVLAVATVIEIFAYYIPVVDNILDSIAIPVVLAVGTSLTAASLGEDIDPVLRWTIAVIAGGGSAGIVEGFSSISRIFSTGLTGGMGNFLFSTLESLGAALLSILGVFLPVFAVVLAIIWLGLAIWQIWKYFGNKQTQRQARE